MPRMTVVIKFFIALFLLFLCHRILTFNFLLSGFEQAHENVAQIFIVGLMSDLWIAGLASATVCLLGRVLGRSIQNWLVIGIFFIAAITTVLHQGYVEFFRFQIIPYHLEYLIDRDFIKSNSASLLSLRPVLQLLFSGGIFYFLRRYRLLIYATNGVRWAVFGPLFLTSLATHAMNIHFRVQLFVPESLQLNVFEKLATDLVKTKIPSRLTRPQLDALAKHLGITSADPSIETVLTRSISNQPSSPVLTSLKQRLQSSIARGEKPLIAVILAESLRASEVGVYGDGSKPSITPELDTLANYGIAFRNVYSTGTVTRGAQEAVFCGYVGGMSTSLMRNRPDAQIKCLPEMTANLTASQGGTRPFSFWYHGGEGRFDGQLSFWSKRGVNSLLSFKDFDRHTPQTDWGYSDLALFATSLQKISSLRNRSDASYLYGVILTVTNHIPWGLPSDSPAALASKGLPAGHESYHTTAYTDFAIGSFVRGLRESQLWSKTLLVILGDHGNLVEPYQKVVDHHSGAEELQTHIPLILSGGIVENTVKALSLSDLQASGSWPSSHWNKDFTSQADVAPFLAYLLDLQQSRFIGELPMTGKRRAPVMSDLGQGVYFPEHRILVSDKDLLVGSSKRPQSQKEFDTLYFRGFLQLLSGPKKMN